MECTIPIPDDVALQIKNQWPDIPRRALEALALEAYRNGVITEYEVQKLLKISPHRTFVWVDTTYGIVVPVLETDSPEPLDLGKQEADGETREHLGGGLLRCMGCPLSDISWERYARDHFFHGDPWDYTPLVYLQDYPHQRETASGHLC